VTSGHDLRTLLDTIIIRDSQHDRIDATDARDRVYALLGIANDEAARKDRRRLHLVVRAGLHYDRPRIAQAWSR
jgi:hypothetical protein